MASRRTSSRLLASLVAAVATGLAARAGAVTPAPGFTTRTIPTPAVVAGGVVPVGRTVFVGQGTFGVGGESVVRLDGGVATTIATGFNSLGGFDWDPLTDTLYVVDNGGEQAGAATGDTVYAIGQATTRTTAVAAGSVALLPKGSVPFAADVVVAPDGLLVSDGAGPGAGRVLHVANATATPIISGLDYAAGVALDGGTLYVGNVNASFVGAVSTFTPAGAPLAPLIGGLSGVYGLALDGPDVLVTGGFDAGGSTLLAVAPDGTPTTRATGFGFSGDVAVDAVRGEAMVLDFGVSAVTVVCRDADADGTCDACTAGVPLANVRAMVARLNLAPGSRKLVVKADLPLQPTAAQALDPQRRGARLLLTNAAGGVVLDAAVPPGAYDATQRRGWRVSANRTTFRWSDPAGADGLTKVVVKVKPNGTTHVVIGGTKSDVGPAPSDLPLHLTVALAERGACGSATPTCTFNGRATSVKCR